jgi:hypothetical protein
MSRSYTFSSPWRLHGVAGRLHLTLTNTIFSFCIHGSGKLLPVPASKSSFKCLLELPFTFSPTDFLLNSLHSVVYIYFPSCVYFRANPFNMDFLLYHTSGPFSHFLNSRLCYFITQRKSL